MQNTTSSRHWRTGWNGASRPAPSSLPSTKTTLLGPTWPGRGHFAHTQVSPSTRAAGALMMRRTLSVRRRSNKERMNMKLRAIAIVSLLQRKHTSIRRMKELLLGMKEKKRGDPCPESGCEGRLHQLE